MQETCGQMIRGNGLLQLLHVGWNIKSTCAYNNIRTKSLKIANALLLSCLETLLCRENTHTHTLRSLSRLSFCPSNTQFTTLCLFLPCVFFLFSKQALCLSSRRLRSGTGTMADSKLMTVMVWLGEDCRPPSKHIGCCHNNRAFDY